MFTCKDINEDFELIVESCIVAFTHTATELDGKIEFKSIVAVDLPLGGVGYIEATDITMPMMKQTGKSRMPLTSIHGRYPSSGRPTSK